MKVYARLNYKVGQDKAESDIQGHILLSENTIINPIQICIKGIYVMLLIKLNGKKVSQKQQLTLTGIDRVLGYLSEVYKKRIPVFSIAFLLLYAGRLKCYCPF